MNEFALLQAMEGIGAKQVQEAGALLGYTGQKARRGRRKLWRTLLLAAVIASLLGVTAYAIGYGIHQQRQQELRQKMQIDEHQVENYMEYPVPTEEAERGQTTVTLLSSMADEEFIKFYFNISPLEKEEMVEEQGNITLARIVLRYCCSFNGKTASLVVPVEENGQVLYDEASKTLTCESSFLLEELAREHAGFPLEVTVRRRVGGDGIRTFDYLEELGRFTIEEGPAMQSRVCLFDTPLEFQCEELGKTGRVLGVELHPSSMTWLLEHEDADRFYYDLEHWKELSSEELDWLQAVQAPWANAIDRVARGILHMDDSTDFDVLSAESGIYEDGIVKRYSQWELQTIDINAVTAITVGGTRIELN